MSKILITGGNGYICAQVLIAALNKGYQVVSTVRNEEKGKQTKIALEKKVGSNISNLSFVSVPVVEEEGAFDEVLKAHQFTAVIHTATPYHFNSKDPNEIVSPAVGGTKSILKSIKNVAPTVKRVVITSSFASIVDPTTGYRSGHIYTEEDWNPISMERTTSGDPVLAYYGAKKWAEVAAWDFMKEEKPQFDLVAICPPMVFGEAAQYTESLDKLSTSCAGQYAFLTGQKAGPNKEIEVQDVMIFVNVTDTGLAHVLALEAPDAGNKRFLTCADKAYSNKEISDAFVKNFPDLARNTPTKLPEGVTPEGFPVGGYYDGDNSLSKRILGIQYQDIEQTMVQFVESIKDLPKTS